VKRILVLVSGSGSNLQAIIDKCESGYIAGSVVGVISNVPNAYALERAKRHNIPALTLDHKQYKTRESFDQDLAKNVHSFAADLIVLAGFMRILSEPFVSQFSGKMLNIHPSLLPKYPGLQTHKKALQNNDDTHGASIHFVNAELDGGPVVIQSIVKVDKQDTIDTLQSKVARTEWTIYPLVVKWFCEGALRLQQDQVWFNNEVVETSLIIDKPLGYQMMINNNQGKPYNEDTQ
jgi:phosphoribosylglycinamide formyltransferase-1